MNKHLKFHLLLSLVIALSLLGGVASSAFAADTPPEGKMRVILTLNPLQPIQMGSPLLLEGTIRDRLGAPVPDKSIVFYIAGEVIGQVSSDSTGHFSRTIIRDLDAGDYKITAVSRESHTLLGTATVMSLKVQPATLIVQTTPVIEGVAFSVGGKKFYSDAKGLAEISIDKVGSYTLEVLANEYKNSTQKIEFGRWLDEIYVPRRDLYIPKDKIIQVGLNVYHRMGQNFVDLDGFPVDPARITQITFRSLQGDSFSFSDGTPRWIPASRVSRWTSVLNETKIYYSVTSVMIDGSNVVNQSQQRFYTSESGVWNISLILYSLQVNARDGLFGSPVGKSITLEYPDGHTANFSLDANGSAIIHSLARGTYYITVNGVSGMINRLPVVLSKNQVVNSKILTSLDISLSLGLLVAAALAMLFIGRPWLIAPLLRTPRSKTAESATQLIPGMSSRKREEDALNAWRRKGRALRQIGLSRDGFERRLEFLESNLSESVGTAKLTLSDQLTLTLRHLRMNASEADLAKIYQVSKSTIHRTIQKVENALNACEDFRIYPRTSSSIPADENTTVSLKLGPDAQSSQGSAAE